MAKITLNLGAVLSELLKGANSNFTELYNAISKIQEKIADDGEKAVVYATVDAMVTGLNTGKDGAGNDLSITIGDEIYILDDETPDFWVSAVSTTATTGTKPASWEKDTNYAFGKYTIRVSKSREIDLTDYQKIANLVTSIGADSDDTHYPSAKAVYDAVKDKVDKVTGKGLSTNDYTNDEKTKVTENTKARHSHSNKALLDAYDQTNANIKDAVTKKHSHSNKTVLDGTTASYTTEEKTKLGNIDNSLLGVTADQIGKVKDVTVNGKSVLNSNGTAVITISELKSGYVSITTADSRWTTKAVNGTTYQALKVEKTSMAIEVYNSNNQKIVAQNVFDDSYLYICVGTAKIACTLRTMSGSSVGGGDWQTGKCGTFTFTEGGTYHIKCSALHLDFGYVYFSGPHSNSADSSNSVCKSITDVYDCTLSRVYIYEFWISYSGLFNLFKYTSNRGIFNETREYIETDFEYRKIG